MRGNDVDVHDGERRRGARLATTMAAAATAAALAVPFLAGGSGPTQTASAGPVGTVRSASFAEAETCADGGDPTASLSPSSAAGPAVARIQERGRLVVGVDQNSYLWGYRDPATGELAGFDIDLVRAVAEDLLGPDPQIVFRTIPTARRIPAIREGEVDMVVRTMTIDCDRVKEVAFSTAYFLSGQQLVVPEDSDITGLDDSARGRRVCSARGSTAEKLLEAEEYAALDVRQVKVANQLDCLVRLQLGEADAVLTDNALGAGQVAQDPSVKLVGEPATVEPYGVAMNLEDDDLVRRVNRVLEKYRAGGDGSRWRASYDRWLADMMDPGTEPAPPEPVYRD
ncbi:glutamate ABC transporter substrate-binding protein [Streptomyces sp. RKND-216]|uniref:glutamate ABC transporter substrate-binding protein n=1 Tax=Streptomyces sp. RKND-216 TaxID=2562581 RepID=UPI00109DBDC5|nr:glutamate ABC transporter substrate-binding protein [Streptomyces sp. RKND-216]THA27813.1 glutamate ABC transporter substrate-binding protein [Streptomyces sp. RKND-216]